MTSISANKLAGVEKEWLTLNGRKVRYLALGRGQPVLMIHGWLGSSVDFPTLFPFLAKHFRVIVPDLPGFGESQRLEKSTISAYAEFFEAFRKVLGISNFALVGNCFGATIALDYAISFPEHCQKLVLFTPIYSKRVLKRKFWPIVRILKNSLVQVVLGKIFQAQRVMWLYVSLVVRHARGHYKEDIILKKRQASIPAAVEVLEDLLRVDYQGAMRKIKIPTSVVYFEKDGVLLPGAVKDIKRFIPQVRFVFAKGKGHFVDPDLMYPEYEKILEFLKKRGS